MAKEALNIREQLNWHWRNNMRPVRFFALDARASLAFMTLLVYARTSTLIFALLSSAVFYWLDKKGLTFPAAMRSLRCWFTGPDRPAWASVQRKRLIDRG